MKTEALTFRDATGQTRPALFDQPQGPRRATALFAHCFACSETTQPARRIAQRLTEAGIAVLRLDFTGLGDGEGPALPALTPADLAAAAAMLEDHHAGPDLLIGHSLAGPAILEAAGALDHLRAVVTLAAPFAPDAEGQNFVGRIEAGLAGDSAMVEIGPRRFAVGRAFLESLHADRLAPVVHDLDAALLVMHAPRDAVVGIDNAQAIFKAALHPKSFVTLDDADHLLTDPADAEYAASVIAAWATRYLDLPVAAPAPAAPAHPAPEGVVRVTELDPEGFLHEVVNGADHVLLADEPEHVGGTNKGLNPYAFLKAGLGSCTSMTMRMYARVKKWPVTGLSVEVSHDKLPHPEGAKDERGRPIKIDVFTRKIRIEGPLDAEQRARLVEIADRCPVHKTLHQASRIETVLAD